MTALPQIEAAPLAAEHVARFILAGNATFTVVSAATGTRFTYRVRAPKEVRPGGPTHFVELLTGPNNTADFAYIGFISAKNGAPAFVHGRAKAKAGPDAPSVKALTWISTAVFGGWYGARASAVQVWHQGRCGKCGRALTVPESLATGMGPVCAAGGAE